MKLFLFLFFLSLPVFSKPCGVQGTIEERIKDCSQTKGNFVLITVTEKGDEFYRDVKSGLIWGSRIVTEFNHYGSQKACDQEVSGYQILGSLKWRLPTIKEFESAASHGMKLALPGMEHSFWSSTPFRMRVGRRKRSRLAGAFIWDGFSEKTDNGDLKDAASVRCVAKE